MTTHSDRADSIGVAASVLCTIHCAITPFLLILAWAGPWILALTGG
jgi:hypothetical protein